MVFEVCKQRSKRPLRNIIYITPFIKKNQLDRIFNATMDILIYGKNKITKKYSTIEGCVID